MVTAEEKALQDKSDMLDDVNKLLDLMAIEKQSLSQKIADLELQLRCVPCCSETVEKLVQTESPNKCSPINVSEVRALIKKDRDQLKELDARVEQLSLYCTNERGSMQADIDKKHDLLKRTETNLRKQTRENKTLSTKLEKALATQEELKKSNRNLINSLEEMRQKYMKTRTSLLAVRGRKVTELRRKRTSEEEKRIRAIMCDVEKKSQANKKLEQLVQDKDSDITDMKRTIAFKEAELDKLGEKYKELQQGVEERLQHFERELTVKNEELHTAQSLLASKEAQLSKTQLTLQEEQKKSVQLLTKNRSIIDQLTSQLEKERRAYEDLVHSLTVELLARQSEHSLEMERLRDVSTKRCTQLAKEVWTLKAKQR